MRTLAAPRLSVHASVYTYYLYLQNFLNFYSLFLTLEFVLACNFSWHLQVSFQTFCLVSVPCWVLWRTCWKTWDRRWERHSGRAPPHPADHWWWWTSIRDRNSSHLKQRQKKSKWGKRWTSDPLNDRILCKFRHFWLKITRCETQTADWLVV